MLPTSLNQLIDTPFFLLLVIELCFVLIVLMRQRLESLLRAEKEVFATTYDIETTYDEVVKEVEEWRRRSSRRWTLNPLKWGRPIFAVYRKIRPKLYRVVDRNAGIIEFELTSIDGGGTLVKASHSSRSLVRVMEFKAKLPVKTSSSISKVCRFCRRVHLPSYTHCPYCGVALT